MIFRAEKKDTGELVKGYYVFGYSEKLHYIIPETVTIHHLRQNEFQPTIIDLIEIRPETLAMETTIKDKNDKMIFGSIPVNGKMSEGGDRCKCHVFIQELGENMGVCEGEKEFICRISLGPTGVWLEGENKEDSGPIFAYDGFHGDSLEIIDPELLEEKQGKEPE